jgi:maltooligosyltrehalose trehalohydrolase
MLFQGEEWGAATPFLFFTDYAEANLAEAVRVGREREFASFGWQPEEIPDPQDPETFRRSRLDWSSLSDSAGADLFDWHRQLIRLRRSQASLSDGRLDLLTTRHDEKARWLVVERGPMRVVCNLASYHQCVPLRPGTYARLLHSDASMQLGRDGVTMSPDSVAILATT